MTINHEETPIETGGVRPYISARTHVKTLCIARNTITVIASIDYNAFQSRKR
jgi:hypothetical protein